MPKPTVAVVICAYTTMRWDALRAAVSSAAAQDLRPDELWLVVDHCPELLARARKVLLPAHPRLRVVANTRRRGLSGARNTALQHVSSDLVVFLDDDAAAASGWLARLLQPYTEPDVMAVGGSAQPVWPRGRQRPASLPSASGGWGELDWVVGCSYRGQPEHTADVRNLMGCNMSFRREVFVTVGGFSEGLGRVGKTPLGGEETELCIRARRALGGRIVFEPSAVVTHAVSRDRLSWRYLRRRCYAEGVSKAAIATLVGADRALDTERSYVLRVLPRAVLRGLTQAVAAPRTASTDLRGSFAIVYALTLTAVGYVRGRVWAQPQLAVPAIRPALTLVPNSNEVMS